MNKVLNWLADVVKEASYPFKQVGKAIREERKNKMIDYDKYSYSKKKMPIGKIKDKINEESNPNLIKHDGSVFKSTIVSQLKDEKATSNKQKSESNPGEKTTTNKNDIPAPELHATVETKKSPNTLSRVDKAVKVEKTVDKTLHPKHYAANGSEDLLFLMLDKGLLDKPEHTAGDEFCVGNMIKYIVRFKKKNGVQDLKKAKVYFNRINDKPFISSHVMASYANKAQMLAKWYQDNFGKDEQVEQLLSDIIVWYYTGALARSIGKQLDDLISSNK